jgi:hypothetical protein
MCAELGFHVADDNEPGLKVVTLPLNELQSITAH